MYSNYFICFISGNKCRPPDILNGISSPHRVNHTTEDEIRYECKGGFSPSILGTVVKCRSTGWFPAPRCSCKIYLHLFSP